MCVPLIVRLFHFVSTERNPSLEQILQHPLLPAQIMLDDDIFWGKFPIVGRKTLALADIDFPCGCGNWMTTSTSERQAFFFWGFGVHEVPPLSHDDRHINSGLGVGGLSWGIVKEAAAGKLPRWDSDLMHPQNSAILNQQLDAIGYDGPLDYAAYARWAGCLSPEEFIARVQPPLLAGSSRQKQR